MVNSKAKITADEKLVDVSPPATPDIPIPKLPRLTKKIRRVAEPHIRGHKVKGRNYYYYVRGTDPEIYLGDADTILRAVRESKYTTAGNRGS